MDVQRLERFLINNGVGAEQAKKIAEDGIVKKEELANTGLTEEQQQSIFGFQEKEYEKRRKEIDKKLDTPVNKENIEKLVLILSELEKEKKEKNEEKRT